MRAGRYLVTGGAGFIGSHLTEHLLAQGQAVTVLDDFSSGKRQNLAGLGSSAGDLRVVEGSILDAAALERCTADAAGIFHLAAVPSVARSVEAPLESHQQNLTATVQVLEAARRRGLKVVFAGSSAAYGEDPTPAKHERLREQPLSPYAAGKVASELYCRVYAHVYGLPVAVMRFFNVFGPRQVPDSPYSGVVAAFCFALLKAGQGARPRIDGDGSQSRDFVYVADVARACRLAMERDLRGCETFNVATGTAHTVRQLLDALMAASGVTVQPLFAPPRQGDIAHSLADIGAARQRLGYAPQVSFADGLKKTFDWYRSCFA